MGDLWHKVQSRAAIRGVLWRSFNYALYGDMSRRMFASLSAFSPDVEPYSIDEMFLTLQGSPDELSAQGLAIRKGVNAIAEIPSCVGIGPTKTIAKLTNATAKADRRGSANQD